jgi:hypothetical protein
MDTRKWLEGNSLDSQTVLNTQQECWCKLKWEEDCLGSGPDSAPV